ncbi:MAG: hypothetical protein ACYC6M_13005 [Terriglobales bacterium]
MLNCGLCGDYFNKHDAKGCKAKSDAGRACFCKKYTGLDHGAALDASGMTEAELEAMNRSALQAQLDQNIGLLAGGGKALSPDKEAVLIAKIVLLREQLEWRGPNEDDPPE